MVATVHRLDAEGLTAMARSVENNKWHMDRIAPSNTKTSIRNSNCGIFTPNWDTSDRSRYRSVSVHYLISS